MVVKPVKTLGFHYTMIQFLNRNVYYFIKCEHNISGSIGPTGRAGARGQLGPKGTQGPEGKGLCGVKYVRWGRTNCSGDAQVVYSGEVSFVFSYISSRKNLFCRTLEHVEEIFCRNTYK